MRISHEFRKIEKRDKIELLKWKAIMWEKEDFKVSVILPAYNEEKNIEAVVNKTIQAFKDNRYKGEIIIINDGSKDRTGSLAEELAGKMPNITVFHHHRNKGLTESLQTGFRNSTGDIVVFLCSDQQSNPVEDIPKLVEKIKEGYDVVLGARQGRREMRVLVSKVYHWLSRVFFGTTFRDMNWIKAFRAEVVRGLKLRSDWHRYIPILAYEAGYRITEVATNYYPRTWGRTKFGSFRIIRGLLDLISIKFHITFLRNPLLLFGMGAMFLIFSGFLLGVFLVLLWLIYRIQIRPALLLVVLFILSGMQLFAIGLLAESFVTLSDKLDDMRQKLTSK
jgi:glycosyltransferase involved in cell wall biosynthesis